MSFILPNLVLSMDCFIAYDTKCHFKSRCHAEKGDACKSELEEQGRGGRHPPDGAWPHRRPGPPCRAGTGQERASQAPGSLKPRGLLREHSKDSRPWRAGRPVAHCLPSRLCRAGASSPSRAVPENNNPKQTAKLSKHTFFDSLNIKREKK